MPLFKKKAEMPTPEEIEAGKVKSYKDLIAPSVVSFRRSPGYYILGNTYRCVWAIRSYAETVEKDSPEIALLRELGESDGRHSGNKSRDHRKTDRFPVCGTKRQTDPSDRGRKGIDRYLTGFLEVCQHDSRMGKPTVRDGAGKDGSGAVYDRYRKAAFHDAESL